MTAALKTDAYEYTMLSSLVAEGLADQEATFELFARKLPSGRRFGLIAGLGRALDMLADPSEQGWTLSEDHLTFLQEQHLLTPQAANWLREHQEQEGKLFSGDLYAYAEGDLYHPYSPVVRVSGKLGEAILLETLLLSIINHDTAVASAAARMTLAAQGRPIIEMGSRRTDDEAAVSAARAAYLAGFASTSNVLAGQRYGIPLAGTAAHAYTLANTSEEEGFLNQMRTWGTSTTLLVDTYDTTEGIRRAVRAAQELGASGPGAIRIDSGDLAVETGQARALLDSLGATSTRIVVSSDLDEYLMTELTASPIDGYGAGTRVVTGSGHPTAGMVYKLVSIDGRAVAKKSADKGSLGGIKTPYRDEQGQEYYSLDGSTRGTPVQHQYVQRGEVMRHPSLAEVREKALATLEALPTIAKQVSQGTSHMVSQHDGY